MLKKTGILSSNQLKIIALVAMTFDHIGKILLPDVVILQIIGRISFPIFAYMLAEGCKYTKSRKKHFIRLFLFAVLCQSLFSAFEKSLYQCIFVTFTLSVLLIYLTDNAIKNKTKKSLIFLVSAVIFVYFSAVILPLILKGTDFYIDYGIWGIFLPVFIYYSKDNMRKLFTLTACLVLLSLSLGTIQWYCLLSVPILFLYNGKKGRYNIKNLFYLYYPLHIILLNIISELIK